MSTLAQATTYSQAIKVAEVTTYDELKELFTGGNAADIIPQRQQLRGAWGKSVWDKGDCPESLQELFDSDHPALFRYEFYNQRKGDWERSAFTADDNVVVYFHGLGRMVTLRGQA